MKNLNLARCSFLSAAYAIIREYPGCCKAEVIRRYHRGCKVAQRTYSYENAALNRLISAGLVRNLGNGAYSFYAVEDFAAK